ncbi:hypothetical protein ACWCXK_05950 [Streptomyces sp. NPDC001739]
MPDYSSPPTVSATDTATPQRVVTHEHFAPGDRVVVICGSADGDLAGEEMRVVAPSWHLPTGEDGWRLRNPQGGQRTFITAHPRYLIHLETLCPDCTGFLRKLAATLLPQLPKRGVAQGGWYQLTALDQLVHTADLGKT